MWFHNSLDSMFVVLKDDLIVEILRADCFERILSSDPNGRWCMSDRNLFESALAFSFYDVSISYLEYRYLGGIFIRTIEDEKSKNNEYTGREGREKGDKKNFEPDVQLRVRKACSSKGCINWRKTFSIGGGCGEMHFGGCLIVDENKMDDQGNDSHSEYFVNSMKSLLRDGGISFPKLWRSMGNILRGFAIRRGFELKGCEGESVMMSDRLRMNVKLSGKPLLPIKITDDMDAFKRIVENKFSVSSFIKALIATFNENECKESSEIGLRISSLWRFNYLLVVFLERDPLLLFLLVLACDFSQRGCVLITFQDFPKRRIDMLLKKYRKRMACDNVSIPFKWQACVSTYLRCAVSGNLIYFVQVSLSTPLNKLDAIGDFIYFLISSDIFAKCFMDSDHRSFESDFSDPKACINGDMKAGCDNFEKKKRFLCDLFKR